MIPSSRSCRTLSAAALGLAAALFVCVGHTPLQASDANRKTDAAADPAFRAAAALYEGIRTETLPNGLHVYLKPVPKSPIVTTMVAYKVGSADENLNSTGLSHYLEHLMFKGTEKIMPGDIDRMTLINGGQNNAYTTEDFTVFYFDFAADRWQPALDVEADRMQNLRIDSRHEFQQEKGAVIEELERNEDTPWDLENKVLIPLLFGKMAPYGHPVIGERQHVRAATAAIIKGHYDRWYHPNNASLVICGGFDPDQTMARIRELFGPIPSVPLPTRNAAPEVFRTTAVHAEMRSKFEVPRLLMAYNTVPANSPDYYPLEVLQALLTGGKTSRLYKKMIEGTEMASAVDSGDSVGRYPGSFTVQVELLKGKDINEAENIILAELNRLREQPVSEKELHRVKRGVVAGAIFDRENVHNLADTIARGVTISNLDWVKNYLPGIAAVSAADVRRVARKYFDPNRRVVVRSLPGGEGTSGAAAHDGGFVAESAAHAGLPHRSAVYRSAPKAEGVAGQFSLKSARRVVLDNGLTLLLFEKRELPIVVAEALISNVRVLEPAAKAGVATLAGRLLDEGTPQHTGPQIAELIENVGGQLGFSSASGSMKVLSPDRQLGLKLLIECLSQASFPENDFRREKTRLLSDIADIERRPEEVAQMTYREILYGKNPLGRPSFGRRATVETLSRDDCVAFHGELFVPDNAAIAIVGDFDADQVVQEVKELTAGWKKTPVPNPELPPIEPPKEFVQKILTMPRAAQLHFYLGSVGIRRDNPDYYKLVVMDYVLGTGPGFTDRLSSLLRDRMGLAYTVNANISSSATEQPGLFTCYIGTPPQNFALVKKAFLQELNRIRDEKPGVDEVENAKKYLLGSLAFQLVTSDRITGELLYTNRYHLGFDYLDEYRKAIAAVTPQDVQAVARKYLDPQHMVLVAAGALDQNGKPLAQPSPGGGGGQP